LPPQQSLGHKTPEPGLWRGQAGCLPWFIASDLLASFLARQLLQQGFRAASGIVWAVWKPQFPRSARLKSRLRESAAALVASSPPGGGSRIFPAGSLNHLMVVNAWLNGDF
jgi:hypothetical protein